MAARFQPIAPKVKQIGNGRNKGKGNKQQKGKTIEKASNKQRTKQDEKAMG